MYKGFKLKQFHKFEILIDKLKYKHIYVIRLPPNAIGPLGFHLSLGPQTQIKTLEFDYWARYQGLRPNPFASDHTAMYAN